MDKEQMLSTQTSCKDDLPSSVDPAEPAVQIPPTERTDELQANPEMHPEKADRVHELLEEMGSVRNLVDELVGLARLREETIARLYEENRQLRIGELKQALKPAIQDLMRLHDMIRDSAAAWRSRGCTGHNDVFLELECLRSFLLDILSRQGVRQFRAEPGEVFNPRLHCAARTAQTTSPELDRRVRETLSDGFLWDDRVIRFVEAEVYVLVQQEVHTQVEGPGAASSG